MSGVLGQKLGLDAQLYSRMVSLAGAVLAVAQHSSADIAESVAIAASAEIAESVAIAEEPVLHPYGICRHCFEFKVDGGRLLNCEDVAQLSDGCPGIFHQYCESLPNHRVCTITLQCRKHIEEEGRRFASARTDAR